MGVLTVRHPKSLKKLLTKSPGEKIRHIIPKKHRNRYYDCKKNFNDIKRLGMIIVTLSVFYAVTKDKVGVGRLDK
ncbi:hypothetical protein [Moraxella bovis]|uniref:Uncharacterized protein n=1 Tax=Moraxella bovis TaxID=476 RepID=A0A1T0A5T6_MORBO|nr:hypothetical protein [Moraxella bovis]OOR91133.1 hypothetical protein B0182_03675 [Moraxella bovis]UZA16654.1 hypothetical protein LP109_13775 [Moraxella bovis]STY90582.1 Uncharacterised protein [Moraxella bovis]